jgi:hypothetical protein
MNPFFAKVLKVLFLILGIVLLLIGIGLLAGLAHEFPKHDSNLLLGLGFIAAVSLALAAFLLRIATLTAPTCKPVWRMLLMALGVLSLLLSAGLAVRLFFDRGNEGPGFSIFFLCTVVFLPAALGYFFFRIAGNLQESLIDVQRSRVHLYRLGQVMTLCFVLAIVIYLPTAWRVVAVFLLALFFVRVHRGWSSRRFVTPLGSTSYAEVFDFAVQGTLYLAVRALFAALIGGRGGGSFSGGGGSSGGGGASGKW